MKASTPDSRIAARPKHQRVRASDRKRARILADTVADLISAPFDAEEFAVSCGLQRGRSVQVATSREMFDTAQHEEARDVCLVTGLAMTYRCGDVMILVREGIVGVHRKHVILHELAHVLFEHHPSNSLALTDRQVRSLFGDLFTPDAVRSALAGGGVYARSGLSTDEEREAEAFADEVLTRTAFKGDRTRRSIVRKYGFIRP